MSDETNQDALAEAYQLIEDEQLDEALAILEPVVGQEQGNVDAWWLYAHAVPDADKAHAALTKVLALDPGYAEATELLRDLELKYPEYAATGAPSGVGVIPPATLPGLDKDDELVDLFDENEEQVWETSSEQRPRQRRLLFGVLIIISLVAVVTIGLILTSDTTPTPTPAPTQVAQVAPTDTLPTVPPAGTDVATETASVTDPLESLYSALAAFDVPDDGVGVASTDLGTTLLTTVCRASGLELGDTLFDIMDVVSKQDQIISDDLDAIGVRLVDCDEDLTLRVIGVSVEDAQAYASGAIDAKEFQRRWKPLE